MEKVRDFSPHGFIFVDKTVLSFRQKHGVHSFPTNALFFLRVALFLFRHVATLSLSRHGVRARGSCRIVKAFNTACGESDCPRPVSAMPFDKKNRRISIRRQFFVFLTITR